MYWKVNPYRSKRTAVADSVAVPEGASGPLDLGPAVAELCAALCSRRTACRPLDELHRSPEGGGGTAPLAVTCAQEAGLAASGQYQENNQHCLKWDSVTAMFTPTRLTTLLMLLFRCLRGD